MAKVTSAQLERQLNEAFKSFRQALQSLLEEEAQTSVQRALDRIAKEGTPFSVSDAKVEVMVTGLTVAAGDAAAAPTAKRASTAPPKRTRTSDSSSRRRGGRRRGGVREALLASFDKPGAELSIEDLGTSLQEQGVQSTSNNVHQQLRRLVQAGELTRAGRGIYKRA
jgi:hypothetical protein